MLKNACSHVELGKKSETNLKNRANRHLSYIRLSWFDALYARKSKNCMPGRTKALLWERVLTIRNEKSLVENEALACVIVSVCVCECCV